MSSVLYDGKKTFLIEADALSDRGRYRKVNQDAVFYRTGRTDRDKSVGLYVVCDGLGGHQAGEVASQIAVETISSELAGIFASSEPSSSTDRTHPSYPTVRHWIQAAITKANTRLQRYALNHKNQAANLSTTVTLALIQGHLVHIANVGDGRAYLWRAGQVTQITQDHSFAAALAEIGQIEENEIATHPQSHVLLQALGVENGVEVDLFEWELQPDDKLLLCSDGLWKAFSDTDELAWWLGLAEASADLCWRLVLEANRRDGSDNISAIVVNVN